MAELFHLNCVRIFSPYSENVCGHCLLIREHNRLVLIDTGIGLQDIQHPQERIGKELIDMVGYRFDENQTAIRQIERLGFHPDEVCDCIISHLDNDHTGGLADFPNAIVHVGQEEYDNYVSGNPRYLKTPLSHHPVIKTYETSHNQWFGFEARKVSAATDTEILLIPMFGHTLGHCGVALKINGQWILYAADAYYLREELNDPDHPVTALAEARADDNNLRRHTLDKIRTLIALHLEIEVFGYHDINEFHKYTLKIKNTAYAMTTAIQNSTSDDLDEIFRLYRIATDFQKAKAAVHWPEFDRRMILSEILEDRQWKIEIDGKIACVWATTFSDPQIWEERNEDPALYIHRIATDPDFRGQNLVTEIVRWAKEYAARNNKKFIRMDTVGENKGLISYYEKCGFKFLGLSTLKNTEGLPAHYNNATVCLFEIRLK